MARSSRTTPASPWRITAPLVVSSFAYATAQNTIVPVIPQVQEATGSSASQVAWMITGFFVSSAGLAVLTGRLGDLFGRKRVLCAILAIFGGGAAIAALGNSLAPIIAGRVVMGVGGGVFPLAYAILSAHLPRDRAAFGMGLISSMFGVGGALGLPLGGLVAGHFGHKGLFWATAAVALLALATVAGAIPSDRGERTGTVDWLGAILLTLALGGPLTAVSRAEEWGWAAPWTLGLLALGAVASAVFLVVERKVSHPLVDLDVMRRRNVWAANLVTLLATTGHGVMFFLVPQIVQLPKSSGVGLGVDVDHSGLFLLPGAVLLIFAGPLTGRLVARFGTRLPLALGVALGCAGLVILAAGSSQPVALLTGGAVLGLAGGVTYATLPMLIADSVPLTDLGSANGVNTIVRHVSMAVSAQLAAALVVSSIPASSPYPQWWAFTANYGAAAVLAALALIPIGLLRPRQTAAPDPVGEHDAAAPTTPQIR